MKSYLLRLIVAVLLLACLVFSQHSTAQAHPTCFELIAEGVVPAIVIDPFPPATNTPLYQFVTPAKPVWIKVVTTNSNPAAYATAAIAVSYPGPGESGYEGSIGTPTTTTWSYTSLPTRRVKVYGVGQILSGVKGTLTWQVYVYHECD